MPNPIPSFARAATAAVALVAVLLVAAAIAAPASQADPRAAYSHAREAAISLPTLALPVEEQPAPAPVVPSWSIGITAFGWQDELDACQWVLMDMVAEVPLPIVAAHNYCGGDIVLSMAVGDTVTLSGYGFDGTYVVTSAKDAWAGDDAAVAISGMAGEVILQTCYWVNDGTERLVGLERVG